MTERIIMFESGEQYKWIPVNHLSLLSEEINRFKEEADLNDFQKWIVSELYQFSLPETGFIIKSILLVAVPHPMYSQVTFQYKGKEYSCRSPVFPDFEEVRITVMDSLSRTGNKAVETQDLPLKRLSRAEWLATGRTISPIWTDWAVIFPIWLFLRI